MAAILTSSRVAAILTPDQTKAAGLSPDFDEICEQADIRFEKNSPQNEASRIRKEYLAGLVRIFKEGGLYQYREGAVKIDHCTFEASLVVPASAPLGEYTVYCYFVENGRARLVGQETFRVTPGGLIRWLTYYAQANAALYGFLSAFVAVMAGLMVGVVFGKGAGH